jgi:uncharacterized protein YegP (UPF0339 family)
MMKLDIYKADDGWRWRFVSRNGKIMADSGEAYSTKGKALKAFVRVKTASWEYPEGFK